MASVLCLVLVSYRAAPIGWQVCYVLVLVSYRASPNAKEKAWYIFMADVPVDQQFIFGTERIDTALSFPSGLLFLVISKAEQLCSYRFRF